jgi:hypothetical protein
MDQFTGGCLCGNVRIVATGQPYRVGICHCLDCRKHHGALFHTSAIFPADVRCSGAAAMKSRSTSDRWMRRTSCSRATSSGPSVAKRGCRHFR